MSQTSFQNSPSAACSKFVSDVAYEDLPAEVVDFMKKDILDWIGCAVGGAADRSSEPIRKVTAELGGFEQATVIGSPNKNAQQAAMCNAYFGHILEMDDVDRESISHPATVNIAPAFAMAEYLGKTGKDLILAAVCGFEVMLRIGAAITPGHYKVFHTTATTGIFGSAMAAGKLLGLSEIQLLWALGNAGTSAAGLWQFLPDGGMSKFLHTANAAGQGILVALLAKEGFSGAKQILEGKQGFFEGYARQEPKYEVFEDFGRNWRTALVSFKPYPCCRHTHSAIDAALDIRRQAEGRKLAKVRLLTYNTASQIAGKRAPLNPRDAKFSTAYCIASTILRGVPSEKDFSAEKIAEPAVKELENLIEVVVDDEINACVPRNWPARIEAETVDGEKLVAQIQAPKGDPENTIDWDGISLKFKALTDGILSAETQDEIISLCRNLENLEDPSILLKKANLTFTPKY